LNGKKWPASYTLKNGELRLEQGTRGWHWYGTFMSINANQSIQLDGSWKHPNPQTQEAAYMFTGTGFVYSWNNGTNVSGDFSFSGNKLILTVSGQIVWEYMRCFGNGGSRIHLIGTNILTKYYKYE
jgi:hypothetical protein